MTVAIQGQSNLLTVQFLVPPNGPLIDVTGLTIKIVNLTTGAVAVGPTSVGIVHAATGLYTYLWVTPLGQVVGDYAAIWTANESTATEEFVVLTATTGQGVDNGPCDGWDAPTWTCVLSPSAQAVTGIAVQAAADVLFALTGRHLGTCTETIRPCRRTCAGQDWPFLGRWWELGTYPRPLFYQGVWYNIACGTCVNGCSCNVVEEALLPVPVAQVLQVKVDGAILDPGAYRVDDWRRLVRLDGGKWPLCNDLTKDDTQVGTWSVTLVTGEAVSPLGNLALGELATRFAQLIACEEDCGFPTQVQQVVRQGVTSNFLDPNVVFADGRLGLYLCDLFISTENPHRLANRSEVYDVDRPGFRIVNT